MNTTKPTLSDKAFRQVLEAIREEPWFLEMTRNYPDAQTVNTFFSVFMRASTFRTDFPIQLAKVWRSLPAALGIVAQQSADEGNAAASRAPPDAGAANKGTREDHALQSAELPNEVNVQIEPSRPRSSGAVANAPPPMKPPTRLRIANARQGLLYRGSFSQSQGPNTELPVWIRNIQIPEDLGLSLDTITCELTGTPGRAGEFVLSFQWSGDGSVWARGECVLTIAPDPKSLWKEIDPPGRDVDEYFKENSQQLIIDAAGVAITGASCRGRSHAHTGASRDDDFFIDHNRDGGGWTVLVVCDGAGSAKHSRWGAKLAASTVGESVAKELSGKVGSEISRELYGQLTSVADPVTAAGREFNRIFFEAAKQAVQAIEEEAQRKSREPREYATTLLAAAIRRDGKRGMFVATLWVGDGAIGVFRPGKIRLMGQPESGDYVGQTVFLDRSVLADNNFSRRLRVGLFEDASAVLLMSDGVSDPYFETESGLSDAARWDALWFQIEPLLRRKQRGDAIVEWMQKFSFSGHYDDRTIVILS